MEKIIDTIRRLEPEINNQGILIEFTDPIEMQEVRDFEADFGFTFPEDYTEFITTHGLMGFKILKSDKQMCDMYEPVIIAEELEDVRDLEGEWSGQIFIFQKFASPDSFDFYAFRKTGTVTDVVSYLDDGGVSFIAPTFTEHIEILLKSMIDGSYRNKYNNYIRYDKAVFDAKELQAEYQFAMQRTFQEAGTYLGNTKDKVKLQKALELYDEVIEYFSTGKVIDDHFLLNANFLKMWAYSYLLGNCRQEFTAAEISALQQAIIKQSEYTLTLVPDNSNHFSDKASIRVICNTLAWYMAESTQQKEVLEKALGIIQQGIDHIETELHYFLYDTQVRILLKLERTEEAYQIIHNILGLLPDFADFQEFKSDEGYNAWLGKL
ncbi:SMI1-KNR4 cell-wall [Chitinophaga sp. YR573]|uniref:SMI1/KNR4 family protein n=1 Tax=Chitinophaga sp. YR573 TaxID=1881040 RepID=UPI0008B64ECC|nr:SMI1/KNR4 family protein [Chitinophaga sp. YR573]SEW34635.1 SMI1-KNR4 cell-wall [Chitinophaga sp. YR573]